MRKYLELFKNGFDATIAEKIKPENWPYIGYSPSEGVMFTVIPEPVADGPWVTFTAEEDNSSIGLEKLSTNQTLEYSTDTSTWNTFDTTTNISLNNGDKVYVRGVLSNHNTSSNYTQFKMSGKIAASGNCNAIWNYQDLNAPLKAYCGHSMFSGCTSLTTSPELPAMTLSTSCYNRMFLDCTSLTTSPELPATAVARDCYNGMFFNCTSLVMVPKILPATELALRCYTSMFYGCTSLTSAPVLPAPLAFNLCYSSMFKNCTSLNNITCLATDISANNCTMDWIYGGGADTGTFIKHPDMNDWTVSRDGIPYGWTVVDAEL